MILAYIFERGRNTVNFHLHLVFYVKQYYVVARQQHTSSSERDELWPWSATQLSPLWLWFSGLMDQSSFNINVRIRFVVYRQTFIFGLVTQVWGQETGQSTEIQAVTSESCWDLFHFLHYDGNMNDCSSFPFSTECIHIKTDNSKSTQF